MFSWRTAHPVALKSIAKVPNQKVARRPKCFTFFFFFRRASSNLRDSFTMVFAQNSSIFHWAVHRLIAFFQVWSHTRRFERLTEELWLPLRRHFSSRVRMRTNHLATKCNYITQDCWIGNTVGVRGMFEESLWLFSQYCIGSLWGETCCSVIDGKLQLKHESAAKKMTWTRIKNIKNVTRCRDSRSAKSIETR